MHPPTETSSDDFQLHQPPSGLEETGTDVARTRTRPGLYTLTGSDDLQRRQVGLGKVLGLSDSARPTHTDQLRWLAEQAAGAQAGALRRGCSPICCLYGTHALPVWHACTACMARIYCLNGTHCLYIACMARVAYSLPVWHALPLYTGQYMHGRVPDAARTYFVA